MADPKTIYCRIVKTETEGLALIIALGLIGKAPISQRDGKVANLEIIQTADGSHSLYNADLNETYHSRHGARQESEFVFIKQGFEHLVEKNTRPMSVLEVGFGTGLNAWLTWQKADLLSQEVYYRTLETLPLPAAVWQKLNYANGPDEALMFAAIHEAPWGEPASLSKNFVIHKMRQPLQSASVPPASIDLVYFDAFAPDKQPDMWTREIFAKVFEWLKPGGVVVTYCAKGQVKRDLRAVGFVVETLPGPPGKREMVRGSRS